MQHRQDDEWQAVAARGGLGKRLQKIGRRHALAAARRTRAPSRLVNNQQQAGAGLVSNLINRFFEAPHHVGRGTPPDRRRRTVQIALDRLEHLRLGARAVMPDPVERCGKCPKQQRVEGSAFRRQHCPMKLLPRRLKTGRVAQKPRCRRLFRRRTGRQQVGQKDGECALPGTIRSDQAPGAATFRGGDPTSDLLKRAAHCRCDEIAVQGVSNTSVPFQVDGALEAPPHLDEVHEISFGTH